MFYSAAVRELFKKKKLKELQVSGSFAHSPPTLTPLASAESANRGLLSNFRDVKFTLGNAGFTQECHQRLWLEQTEITKGSEESDIIWKKEKKNLQRNSCLRRVYHLISEV